MNMVNPIMVHELEEIEDLLFEQSEEQAKQRFEIKDLPSLNWTVRKLAALEAKRDEVKQLADLERERIARYEQNQLAGIEQSENFFKGLIEAYLHKRREEDPKFKKEITPYGEVAFVKQQPEFIYNDEELIKWLEGHEHYDQVKVEKKVANKSELKKLFTRNNDGRFYDENGEQVTGMIALDRPDKITIKLNK
ncbi:host-nuclease inhibitor Gam family protein [Brevibacillus migulae]|uniref:host-nuclease inhibitor Gam family protein n=1 Tax=Brevibacillus migulae TaxID=1644114 RepID=UPI00106DFBBF|nr:host-nuclease inhibitor Gam family protein [Brevibacillus migulae]